jgi:arabinose-5-phosphate isomerase
MDIKSEIRKAIRIEQDALGALIEKVDDEAVKAVLALSECKGRVIVTGMGKGGLIGRKIAATLASTGTPATFLHPAEAFHGDIGFVLPEDVVIAISNSGETEELVGLLPHLKRFGVRVIALTGKRDSTLAQHSDVVIDVGVEKEADPLNMVPTASTTAILAMGDALAAAVLLKRGFTRDEFAIFHPGGSLGKRLLWHVKDLMHAGTAVPVVGDGVTVQDGICEMTSKRLGATFVVDKAGKLVGILTDGDLRRFFQKEKENPLRSPITEAMVRRPKTIRETALAAEAIKRMEDHAITVLPVVDPDERPIGAIHLHDLVKSGLA